jgi:hypothetical protein
VKREPRPGRIVKLVISNGVASFFDEVHVQSNYKHGRGWCYETPMTPELEQLIAHWGGARYFYARIDDTIFDAQVKRMQIFCAANQDDGPLTW